MCNLNSSSVIENIWHDFSKQLKRFIYNHVKNEQDAEDIMQNVFLKIHNNICSLENEEKIRAWIYKIARNTITDYYRAKRCETSLSDFETKSIVFIEEIENVNDDIAQCLKTMVDYLPEKYKTAIILTEFNNLTQKELSERLGLSVPGAKSRVQRARIKLKEMLLECCHLEFDHYGNIIYYQQKCKECKFC